MALITLEVKDRVGIITLNRPSCNAINIDMLKQLMDTMQKAEQDNIIDSVILTSYHTKIFSFGFDLPHLLLLDRPDMNDFFSLFIETCMKFYQFPKPIVAAVNGHAVAGGCILVLCCDYRLAADSEFSMGLNEVKLGLPVPWPTIVMLDDLIGRHRTEQVIFGGKFYQVSEAHALGLVDEIVKPSELLNQAVAYALQATADGLNAYRLMKSSVRKATVSLINQDLEDRTQEFLDLWFSEKVQGMLTEASKRFQR